MPQLIGWLRDGRPVYRIAGGSDGGDGGGTGGTGDEGADGGGGGTGGTGDGDLGNAGKKALDAERAAKRAAEKAARDTQKALEAAQAELAKHRAASQTEQDKALEKARKEAAEAARGEVLADLHRERVEAAVLRAAAGKFADPEDAIVHLREDIEVGPDGRPDSAAVTRAVDELLERKPHLKANGHRPAGSADGGARGAAAPADVTPGIGRLRAAYANTSK